MAFQIVSGRDLPEKKDWDQFCMPNYELEQDHDLPDGVDMCNRLAELGAMPAPPTFAQVVQVADREPALREDLFHELFYYARRRGGCRMTDATIAQDAHFVEDFVVQCHLLQTLWRDDGVVPEFGHLDHLTVQDRLPETCQDMRRTFARLYARSAPVIADIVSAFRSVDDFKASVAMHVMRALYVLRRAPLGLEDTLMSGRTYNARSRLETRKLLADARATAHIHGGVPLGLRYSSRPEGLALVASEARISQLYAFKALPVLFESQILQPSELAPVVLTLAERLLVPRLPASAPAWKLQDELQSRAEAMRLCKRVLLEVLLVTGDVSVDIEGVPQLTAFAADVRDYKREMYNCVEQRVSVWLAPHPSHLVVALVAEKASVKPGFAFMKHMRNVPPHPLNQAYRESVTDAMPSLMEDPPQ